MCVDDRRIEIGNNQLWDEARRNRRGNGEDHPVLAAEPDRTGIEHKLRDAVRLERHCLQTSAEAYLDPLDTQMGECRLDKGLREADPRQERPAGGAAAPQRLGEDAPEN